MMTEDAARSCSPSQSDSESSEELKHDPDGHKSKAVKSLANNGEAHTPPNIKAEEGEAEAEAAAAAAAADGPSPSFKYSHSKLPRPDSPAALAFPMTRVRRLIKSEGDIRTNADAAFLINKAVERFLEQFVQDSFEYLLKENKNTLSYKNLSSNVSKQKRYEFLADFVPEKVKAADALSEKASVES